MGYNIFILILGRDILICISVNHKTANAQIRQRFAFDSKLSEEIIMKLRSLQPVLLCTCCRTEIYFCGGAEDEKTVITLISQMGGTDPGELLKYVMLFRGDSALRHLFCVACGIDSMVIGEDEILGQTKAAYAFSHERGVTGYEMNTAFKAAVTCAKKVKTKTAISSTSVSTATLAANRAASCGEKVNVLLVGATGKIGSSTMKNLLSHKNVSLTATLRSHSPLPELIPAGNIKTVPYSQRYDHADQADCVISATSGPHFTVTARQLSEAIKTRKKRLFIDLAVPPDIDPGIKCLPDTELLTIDNFEELAKRNNEIRLDSAEQAKAIIAQELDSLKKDTAFHNFLPKLENVKRQLSAKSPEEILYKLKSRCTGEEFEYVLKILEKISIKDPEE